MVLEPPWPFQLCPPSPCAPTSETVSVCLVPAGAEHGNWSHAKKTVSCPAAPQVAVNLLLASPPAFQKRLVWVLLANPFAPTQPMVNPALLSLLVWLASASPPARDAPAVRKSAVRSAPVSQAPAGSLSSCPHCVGQHAARQSAVTRGPASRPLLRALPVLKHLAHQPAVQLVRASQLAAKQVHVTP